MINPPAGRARASVSTSSNQGMLRARNSAKAGMVRSRDFGVGVRAADRRKSLKAENDVAQRAKTNDKNAFGAVHRATVSSS